MNLKHRHITGAVFTLLVGTLLHFTYEWSGENTIVALFSAVNESTWEHLKLLVMPTLFFTVFEYFIYGQKPDNLLPVRLISVLLGMFAIISSFYTYTGIIGTNFLFADILTFVLGVFVTYYVSFRLSRTERFSSPTAIRLGGIGTLFLALCFAVFTFLPSPIGLFLDPVSGSYGR